MSSEYDDLVSKIEALRISAERRAEACRLTTNTMSGRLVALACHEGYARDLRAALAGSGEQPGEVTRVEVRGRGYGKTQAMAERVADAVKARGLPAEVLPVPAPVVPDSTGLRERLILALAPFMHADDRTEQRDPALASRLARRDAELAADAVLAVVGQGVTAECDHARAARDLAHMSALTEQDALTLLRAIEECRATERPAGQERADG